MKKNILIFGIAFRMIGCGPAITKSQVSDDEANTVSASTAAAGPQNKVYEWGSDELNSFYDPAKYIYVFDFGATWCTACQHLVPTMASLAQESDNSYVVISVNVDSDAYKGLQQYLTQNNITIAKLPTVLVWNNKLYQQTIIGANDITVYENAVAAAKTAAGTQTQGGDSAAVSN